MIVSMYIGVSKSCQQGDTFNKSEYIKELKLRYKCPWNISLLDKKENI